MTTSNRPASRRQAFFLAFVGMAVVLWSALSFMQYLWFDAAGLGPAAYFLPLHDPRELLSRVFVIGVWLIAGGIVSQLYQERVLSEDQARASERALRETEQLQRLLMESIDAGIVVVDPDTRQIQRVNPCAARLIGAPPDQVLGQICHCYLCPNARGQCPVLDQGLALDSSERVLLRADGTEVPVLKSARLIEIDGRQKLLETFIDISDRKQAEAEKERLHSQLVQAQKMESVGRLAGGVAHDFNNMLQLILGHTALAELELPQGSQVAEHISEIRKAAERSASLTMQLLAFARKQTISPRALDLNEAVEGMLKMLRRLIGEDIQLTWQPSASLWPVRIDPGQLDQILVNLCVNARDAITGVGQIAIDTANAVVDEAAVAGREGWVPGDYVRLTVRDTGCGMDSQVLAHVFEPFFTTKELGKGTGLGLATVYGIVCQNQGLIDVQSELGRGTTLEVFLPRHRGQAEHVTRVAEAVTDTPARRTILLVEDEPAILRLTTTILERLGFEVLPASSPSEALRLAGSRAGEIHLLMTDVVMPEMTGRELASRLLASRPTLATLFMSGYTADVIAHQGVLDPGFHFIQKPFSIDECAAKVREALSGS